MSSVQQRRLTPAKRLKLNVKAKPVALCAKVAVTAPPAVQDAHWSEEIKITISLELYI